MNRGFNLCWVFSQCHKESAAKWSTSFVALQNCNLPQLGHSFGYAKIWNEASQNNTEKNAVWRNILNISVIKRWLPPRLPARPSGLRNIRETAFTAETGLSNATSWCHLQNMRHTVIHNSYSLQSPNWWKPIITWTSSNYLSSTPKTI